MMPVAPIQDEQSAANCEKAVGKSATERVPVEIWQKILSIAISCALLPRDDDDFFQRRRVDSVGCSKIVEYVNSEKVRTNLRPVCRSWDAFLDLHSDRLVFLSWRVSSGHWPPVKNWEHVVRIVGPNFILCSCKSQCPAARVRTPQWKTLPSNIELHEQIRGCLRLLGNRCEAIIVSSPFTGDLVDPERFGSVKMFIGDPFDSRTIPTTYRCLTHLRIIVTSICHPSFCLHLPQLTTLTVSFSSNFSKHPTNPADIGHWDLPILRCITLIAFPKEESVYYLLQQVRRRITECHIIPVGGTSAPVSNSIWRYLPELRILGVSFEQLVALRPPLTSAPDRSMSS
jgi:hypothetical protein